MLRPGRWGSTWCCNVYVAFFSGDFFFLRLFLSAFIESIGNLTCPYCLRRSTVAPGVIVIGCKVEYSFVPEMGMCLDSLCPARIPYLACQCQIVAQSSIEDPVQRRPPEALHSIPCAVTSAPIRLVNGRTAAVALKARTASQSSRFASLVGSLCPAQTINAILPLKMPAPMPVRAKTRPVVKKTAKPGQKEESQKSKDVPVKTASAVTKPKQTTPQKGATPRPNKRKAEKVDYGQAARDLIRRKVHLYKQLIC